MNTLVIAAQDIKSISLAWLEDGVLQLRKDVSVEPDNYLLALEDFLQDAERQTEEIDNILVVTGPGSFTASRVSVTMANALAWSLQVPIAGISNEENLSLADWLESHSVKRLEFKSPPVAATYNRAPNITMPRGSE